MVFFYRTKNLGKTRAEKNQAIHLKKLKNWSCHISNKTSISRSVYYLKHFFANLKYIECKKSSFITTSFGTIWPVKSCARRTSPFWGRATFYAWQILSLFSTTTVLLAASVETSQSGARAAQAYTAVVESFRPPRVKSVFVVLWSARKMCKKNCYSAGQLSSLNYKEKLHT